jgi:hypothetical protein
MVWSDVLTRSAGTGTDADESPGCDVRLEVGLGHGAAKPLTLVDLALAKICAMQPAPQVLVVSMHDSPDFIRLAF